jgi:hypothetical protein
MDMLNEMAAGRTGHADFELLVGVCGRCTHCCCARVRHLTLPCSPAVPAEAAAHAVEGSEGNEVDSSTFDILLFQLQVL